MRVTCTFTTPLPEDKVLRVKQALTNLDSQIVEESRTERTVTFTCPSPDVNPFGELFWSWLRSPDSPIVAYQMTKDS